jgi:hypothetical protein
MRGERSRPRHERGYPVSTYVPPHLRPAAEQAGSDAEAAGSDQVKADARTERQDAA